MINNGIYTYPQCPQRKKKVAKKKEISATTGLIWVRFIRESKIHLG